MKKFLLVILVILILALIVPIPKYRGGIACAPNIKCPKENAWYLDKPLIIGLLFARPDYSQDIVPIK